MKKVSDLTKFFKDHTRNYSGEDTGDPEGEVRLQPDESQQQQSANTQNSAWSNSILDTEDVDSGSSTHSGACADTVIVSPPSSPNQPF